MKKPLLILLLLATTRLFAQTNPITAITITLPTNPDAFAGNWGNAASVFTISASARLTGGRIDPSVEESKILVIIKKNGAKICGSYASTNAPATKFRTASREWNGAEAIALLGKGCSLAPGDYELSVQFFAGGAKPVALSEEKIKPFTIRGNDQQAYQPPQPVVPATSTALVEADIKKPIIFRWTPVIPKPATPVIYRLKIWQLTQGQNGPQAIKANQPILTKDVDNITEAVITNIITGPCKPPYLCSFVWNVQALSRDGKPLGGNNGISESFAFGVKQDARR